MIRSLQEEGVRVPNGFATTAAAYRKFLEVNELEDPIRQEIDKLHNESGDGTRFAGGSGAGLVSRRNVLIRRSIAMRSFHISLTPMLSGPTRLCWCDRLSSEPGQTDGVGELPFHVDG